MFRRLEPRLGFSWATRLIAFIALGTLLVSVSIVRMRPGQHLQEARTLLEMKAFREPEFTILSVGLFLTFAGLYCPFFYTSIYSARVIGISDSVAVYVLPAINAGSVFGRIIPGFVADKVGSLNSIIPCGFAASMLTFAWLRIATDPGIWTFSVLYGCFSGVIVSLPATVVARLSPDLKLVGTRMGMAFTCAGFGFLIGNPIAGALLDVPKGQFQGAQIFTAVALLAGSTAFVIVWVLLAIKKGLLKAKF